MAALNRVNSDMLSIAAVGSARLRLREALQKWINAIHYSMTAIVTERQMQAADVGLLFCLGLFSLLTCMLLTLTMAPEVSIFLLNVFLNGPLAWLVCGQCQLTVKKTPLVRKRKLTCDNNIIHRQVTQTGSAWRVLYNSLMRAFKNHGENHASGISHNTACNIMWLA